MMNRIIKQLAFTSVAISAIAFVPFVVTAQVETVNPMESNVERRSPCSEAAEQYWTPERIRNAQPLPLPTPETEPVPPTNSNNSEWRNQNSTTGEASPPSQIQEDRRQ